MEGVIVDESKVTFFIFPGLERPKATAGNASEW